MTGPGSSSQLMTELVCFTLKLVLLPLDQKESEGEGRQSKFWVWVKFRQIMVFPECPHPNPWKP